MSDLFRAAAVHWVDDYAQSMGAALAFYTMFWIAPFLLIVTAGAGLFFGEGAAKGEIFKCRVCWARRGTRGAHAGGTCGASLAAHASCTLLVNFTPTGTGAINGVVTITYPSTYSPEEVTLTGTGN